MSALIPTEPKIYHIVHVDRLPSIIESGFLLSDVGTEAEQFQGTTIGMSEIKERRRRLGVKSHQGLMVGNCVPFYFCPRSVMLYVIARGNHDGLSYRGGEGPILHLEADLHRSAAWADHNRQRWAFTTGNAGSFHFSDFASLEELDHVNWDAVEERDNWSRLKDEKQAEWLIEERFPWELVERVGCRSAAIARRVATALGGERRRPSVLIRRDWYYNRD